MHVAALVMYTIGLIIEVCGASLVVKQARRLQRRDTTHGVEPGSVIDRMTKWRDVTRLRGDLEDIRAGQAELVPSHLAVALLIGGIVFGYAGNFLSLTA